MEVGPWTSYDGRLDSTVADFGVLRNFLLFIPAGSPSLRAVISYYASTATVNPEGDVHINDSLQGLGKQPPFDSSVLYQTFFITYIYSSSILLATAFFTLSESPTTMSGKDMFEGDDENESPVELERLGTSPANSLSQLQPENHHRKKSCAGPLYFSPVWLILDIC